MLPKISIIVPIYNVEKYLKCCLECIINQTLKEIEIICIDDGSTDNCGLILDKYKTIDSRIRVLKQQNHGYGFAMNRGIEMATGNYIGIVEPDDEISLDMFEKMYHVAITYKVDIVKSNYYDMTIDSNRKRILIPVRNYRNNILYNTVTYIQNNPECLCGKISNWSGIYRKAMINHYHIKHSETPGASYQDIGFYFKTMLQAKNMYFLPDYYYRYRVDNSNASMKVKDKLYFAEDEFQDIENCFFNSSVDSHLYPYFFARRWQSCLGTYRRIHKELRPEFCQHIKKIFKLANKQGNILKTAYTGYEWALLQALLKNIATFENIYRLSESKGGKLLNLFWYLKYDGIISTFRWLKNKYI